MTGLIRAELRKMATTWPIWLLLAVALLLTAFTIFSHFVYVTGEGRNTSLLLGSDAGLRTVIGSGRYTATFTLLLGIIGTTGEYRHNTITQTFLVTPRRGRVVYAKIVAHGLAGAAFGVAACALTCAVGLPWLAANGIHPTFLSVHVAGVLGATVIGCVLFAILGVGFGALVQNQIGAVVIALVWLSTVENLLMTLSSGLEPWLLSGALDALNLQRAGSFDTPAPQAGAAPHSGINGGFVLMAYATTFAIIGSWVTRRRDVT